MVSLALLTVLSALPAIPQTGPDSILTYGDKAIMLSPWVAAPIGSLFAYDISWTGDSRLIIRSSGLNPLSDALANALEKGDPSTLGGSDAAYAFVWSPGSQNAAKIQLPQSVLKVGVISKSTTFFYETYTPEGDSQLIIAPISGNSHVLTGYSPMVESMPASLPYIPAIRIDENSSLVLLDQGGNVRFAMHSAPREFLYSGGRWDTKGENYYMRFSNWQSKPQETVYEVFNAATGRTQTTTEEKFGEAMMGGPREYILYASAEPDMLADHKNKTTAVTLHLANPDGEQKGSLLAAAGGDRAMVSPDEKWIACIRDGVPTVARILHPNKDFIEAQRNAAEKARLISNAKQCALGIIMFLADNDDNFPTNFNSDVLPYIKNQDTMNGFVYTFGGGNAGSIEKPAETEIGYIPGPGGRAVAYADGHVKWVPDQK